MFFKHKYLIFIPSLIMGTFFTMSSSSWFSAWLGLEINLMSMAPLLINKFSNKSVESTIKYFIVQALASIILIFFFIIFSYSNVSSMMANMPSHIIALSLIMKSGMAPFQFWFPQVIMYSEWSQCFVLMTWQKLAPMSLLVSLNNYTILTSIILSALIGALGGLNQINLKIILAYSSILHSSWMFSLIFYNSSFWLIYFSVYTMITLSLLYPLFINNSHLINKVHLTKNSASFHLMFLMNFLSMAGLPPMLGFSIKLASITILLYLNASFPLIIVLISASFLSFYFYLRMSTLTFFNNTSTILFIQLNYGWKSLFTFPSAISFFSNIMLPILVFLA